MLGFNFKKNIRSFYIIGIATMLSLIALYYNIIFDISIITILFLSSYLLGSMLLFRIEIPNKNIVKTVLGLGVIGVVFYFLLFFKVGQKSFFALVLILPIILGRKYIRDLVTDIRLSLPKTKEEHIIFWVSGIFFLVYIACGSSPIANFDALTKHLPIITFAAENGRFNYNVIESIVYGESMVMSYTYSIMFASFNAYKAIILFNVFISFSIFKMLTVFSKSIYKNTSIIFLEILYFSTPMFFELSTGVYLDILPLLFLLGAILCYCDLKEKEAWNSLPIVAFLFGCSVFSKLTISYSILVAGIIIFGLSVLYSYKNKSITKAIKYLGGSFILFIFPFIISLINIWYRTGNPLFPFYNEYFKSPYFSPYNFKDPFNASPLGLTITSLFKIVFQTSKNVEMPDGGLGFFLLLIFIIPVSIVINRSKKIIVWSLAPFMMFAISCLFTYNLRYNTCIFILLLSIIAISLSIIVDKIKLNIILKKALVYGLLITLFIPNTVYILKHLNIKDKIKYNKEISLTGNKSLMSEIPPNKNVLSLNDPLQGEYKGFFSSYTWHNNFNINKISQGNITIEDYISCFDYVIYQKGLATYSKDIDELIKKAQSQDSILIPYDESPTHILYKVKEKKYTIINKEQLEEPKVSQKAEPFISKIDKIYDNYQMTQDIENINETDIPMRFHINWHNTEGKYIGESSSQYTLKPGRHVDVSPMLPYCNGAAYGIVYITPINDEKILIHGYRVDGYEKKGKYLSEQIKLYENYKILY